MNVLKQWTEAPGDTERMRHASLFPCPHTKGGEQASLHSTNPCRIEVGSPNDRDLPVKCVARDSTVDHPQCQADSSVKRLSMPQK